MHAEVCGISRGPRVNRQHPRCPIFKPLLPRQLSALGVCSSTPDILVKAVMIGLAFASLVTWTVWLATNVESVANEARPSPTQNAGKRRHSRGAVRACEAIEMPSSNSLFHGSEAELSDGIVADGSRKRVAVRLGGWKPR